MLHSPLIEVSNPQIFITFSLIFVSIVESLTHDLRLPFLFRSTTLGNLSNSPSACFVASDGESLRVYQAVIDARTLLAEVSSSERKSRMMVSTSSRNSRAVPQTLRRSPYIIVCLQGSLVSLTTESSSDGGKETMLHDKIKIVSQQSTARPGCIIQLDPISDATHVRYRFFLCRYWRSKKL